MVVFSAAPCENVLIAAVLHTLHRVLHNLAVKDYSALSAFLVNIIYFPIFARIVQFDAAPTTDLYPPL